VRPDAVEALAAMRKDGLTSVMVTGDNASAAALVARRLGIDDVHAGVLPDGKADIIRRVRRRTPPGWLRSCLRRPHDPASRSWSATTVRSRWPLR
jgi:hypothetical protein